MFHFEIIIHAVGTYVPPINQKWGWGLYTLYITVVPSLKTSYFTSPCLWMTDTMWCFISRTSFKINGLFKPFLFAFINVVKERDRYNVYRWWCICYIYITLSVSVRDSFYYDGLVTDIHTDYQTTTIIRLDFCESVTFSIYRAHTRICLASSDLPVMLLSYQSSYCASVNDFLPSEFQTDVSMCNSVLDLSKNSTDYNQHTCTVTNIPVRQLWCLPMLLKRCQAKNRTICVLV